MLLPYTQADRTALVIVDMQNYFFRQPETRRNLATVIQNINLASQVADQAGFPVVHVVSQFKADGSDWELKTRVSGLPELIEGTPETAILAGIRVDPHHHRVVKTRYSAFFGTGLAAWLHGASICRVITAGAYTHYCVNATVFDAYSHDFIPGILLDAVISHREDESALMIERMRRNGYHLLTTAEFVQSCSIPEAVGEK
ncbi:cysteine hydrolase [bacterium]|nr:MAG: cysteine hydrolase [bacterium]